jgi:hypothetical protein
MLWQISECAFCWMKKLDWRLGRGLLRHEVETVQRLGWVGIQNGALVKKAE